MNRERHLDEGVFSCPYEDLYIYFLEGRVTGEDEKSLGENYLGNWVEDQSSFLFFSKPSREIVSELLINRAHLKLHDDYHFTYEEWQGQGVTSFRIENLLIVPPWEEVEAGEGEIKIILDPGVVFGTGLHPTTTDCLRALLFLHKRYPWRRVMDLGTGTGILAVAAARLGAERVMAVDLNPLSVKTTRRNVYLNGLEQRISVYEARAEEYVRNPADLIVANIHYEVIRDLFKSRVFFNREWLILSGLLRSQARDFKGEIEKRGLNLFREWDHENTWYTMLVKSRYVR